MVADWSGAKRNTAKHVLVRQTNHGTTPSGLEIQVPAHQVSYRLVVGWVTREDVLDFDLVFWCKVELGILVVVRRLTVSRDHQRKRALALRM